jgi:thiol-disulfide isomerase/thioredoxin
MIRRQFPLLLACVLISAVAVITVAAAETTSYPVLSGVGLALKSEGDDLVVTVIAPNSPAAKSGKIEKGDLLVSVDIDGKRTPLIGMSVGEAASLLRGPVGTKLNLTVARKSTASQISVDLERAALAVDGDQIGYERFIGKQIPDLKLSSLDGKVSRRMSEFRDKIVVLDFWASWCPTCYGPVTKLQQTVEAHPEWADKVEFIAVTVDAKIGDAEDVIRKNKWNKTSHSSMDFDDLKEIGVNVIPVAILISKTGKIFVMAGSHAIDFEKEIANALSN